jgi:hypothetical protein
LPARTTLITTLLAIAGALGSLGLGAFVGALVAHTLRERAENKREESELRGLLRLIAFEVTHNDQVMMDLRKVDQKETALVKEAIDNLRTDAWKDTRVRLAQLLPAGEFNHLCGYYIRVSRLIYAVRTHRDVEDATFLYGTWVFSREGQHDMTENVGRVLMKYVRDFDTDPGYIGNYPV